MDNCYTVVEVEGLFDFAMALFWFDFPQVGKGSYGAMKLNYFDSYLNIYGIYNWLAAKNNH